MDKPQKSTLQEKFYMKTLVDCISRNIKIGEIIDIPNIKIGDIIDLNSNCCQTMKLV